MKTKRATPGFDLSHAESAVAAFVTKIIADTPQGKVTRSKIYSAGLKPDLSYAIKKGRQRDIGAAKLVAALAACEELEVVMEGESYGGAEPARWIVRAHLQKGATETPDTRAPGSSEGLNASGPPVQLSLSGSLQTTELSEIEISSTNITKKDPGRAEIRLDFVVTPRRAV